jgi:hypothetical protein
VRRHGWGWQSAVVIVANGSSRNVVDVFAERRFRER